MTSTLEVLRAARALVERNEEIADYLADLSEELERLEGLAQVVTACIRQRDSMLTGPRAGQRVQEHIKAARKNLAELIEDEASAAIEAAEQEDAK